MSNPMESEYLSWFVLKDDNCKRGCIDIVSEIKDIDLINLSVDYKVDYDNCIKLIKSIGKNNISNISLKEIIDNSKKIKKIDSRKKIKLPNDKSIRLKDYLEEHKNCNYFIREEMVVK